MTAEGAGPASGSFADQAFAVTVDAYARTPGWERGLHAAIGRLFEFLAEHADQTNTCIVTDCGGGSEALDRRDRLIERFAQLLRPGFENASERPPAVVGEAIGGGIYELVRSHVLERRLDELPAATPDATVVALAPFIGSEGAVALATSINVQSNR